MNKDSGRSMVEMLGVLAIIGVLSAGALAGYSKAMFQHKLNQFTDDTTQTTYHADTIKAMNMIPNGFIYYDSTFLQDMFSNKIKPNISKSHEGGITYHFASTDGGKMLSRQLFIIERENSRDLYNAPSTPIFPIKNKIKSLPETNFFLVPVTLIFKAEGTLNHV